MTVMSATKVSSRSRITETIKFKARSVSNPSAKATALFRPPFSRLVSLRWEKFPRPINCTTIQKLKFDATDEKFNRTRKQRQVEDENVTLPGFHWTVRVPVGMHKKPTIRHRVKRRFKHSFLEDLKESGWDTDGKPLRRDSELAPLTGAVCLNVSDADPWAAREIDWDGVKELTRWAVKKVVEVQAKPGEQATPSAPTSSAKQSITRENFREVYPEYREDSQPIGRGGLSDRGQRPRSATRSLRDSPSAGRRSSSGNDEASLAAEPRQPGQFRPFGQ